MATPGTTFETGGYTITFDAVEQIKGPNYQAERGTFTVVDGNDRFVLTPEKRFFPTQRMTTTEAAIDLGITRDVYLVLGDQQGDGWAVRTYIKPFANWIWLGAIVMSFGGLLSLTDRRYRIGAPVARKTPSGAVPAE